MVSSAKRDVNDLVSETTRCFWLRRTPHSWRAEIRVHRTDVAEAALARLQVRTKTR